ncbi:hypothetical protein Tco_1327694 [Tanacetum coccineum]
MARVNMFVDMDTELVKESSKKAEAEMAQESSSKRAGEELETRNDQIRRNLQVKRNVLLLEAILIPVNTLMGEFEDMHVYMLVEKRYPLTPTTITDMLNKKLKSDYWNEMCYQLLKLMIKQLKK